MERSAPGEYRVLAATTNHPDSIHPYRGLFNHRSLRALADTGASVKAVSPRPFAPPIGPYSELGDVPEVETQGPYDVFHPRFLYMLPKRLFYGLSGESYRRRVPEYVERKFPTPDVVHAGHIYLDGYGILPYCRRHDLPLFVTAWGTILNEFDSHPESVQSKIRETLTAATRVLCVSEALVEEATRFVPESKVSLLSAGADPGRFPVENRESIRDELGIPRDATVVLYCGHFTEKKGVRDLMEILGDLSLPDTYFVFVGHGGDLRADLQSAVLDSPFRDRSRIFWKMSPLALRRWFAVSDLLVLPSHSEGRPTVVYEAMASETAVLASSTGGIPEQVADGETGALHPPRDTEALRSELQRLADDRPALRRMGERGRERLVEQGWTWDQHAERLERLHKQAIAPVSQIP